MSHFLVLGDWMWDVYHCGSVSRVSPEAPIPVVKVKEVKRFPGGAGNIVENLKALGVSRVDQCIGDQSCIKNRLMVGDTQVARWDEDKISNSRKWSPWSLKLDQYDAIVVGDYHKGSIGRNVLDSLAEVVGKTMVFVDTKYPQAYPKGCYFFPNVKEYQENREFYNSLQLHQVVITMGEKGFEYKGSRYPTRARFARCVVGAGDTFTSAFAYAMVMNEGDPAGFANIAAGIVVEKAYTSVATLAEIEERDQW